MRLSGQRVTVQGHAYTVVGVAPKGFTGPQLAPVDLWIPLDPATAGNRSWWLVGRLHAGGAGAVDPARAAEEATAIHRRTDPGRFFQWAKDGSFVAAPINVDDAGQPPAEAAVVKLLMAVAGLVLVVAIANVVNLMLARLTRRRREIGVRLALGVGRWRLARLVLAETLVLAVLGGLASLPATYLAGNMLRRVLLPGVPWPGSPLQARALGLTVGVALVTGLLAGLLPVRRANRTDVAEAMRSGRSGGGRSWANLPRALAVAQLTLSAALAVAAGLFLKSFWTMRSTDLGVAPDEVSVVTDPVRRPPGPAPGLRRRAHPLPARHGGDVGTPAGHLRRGHPGAAVPLQLRHQHRGARPGFRTSHARRRTVLERGHP